MPQRSNAFWDLTQCLTGRQRVHVCGCSLQTSCPFLFRTHTLCDSLSHSQQLGERVLSHLSLLDALFHWKGTVPSSQADCSPGPFCPPCTGSPSLLFHSRLDASPRSLGEGALQSLGLCPWSPAQASGGLSLSTPPLSYQTP